MKILVVDDEKLALNRVARLLSDLGYSEIDAFSSSVDALTSLVKNRYDVAFLDIEMPNINGLELANKILEIESSTFIIFQTAYDEFALEAFRVGGVDYILKPTTKESIKKALDKVSNFISLTPPKNRKILGKSANRIYLVDIEDIYYVRADLDEVIIRIKESEVYLRKKISDMQKLLDSSLFFRIHRSIIVNIDKIKSMQSVEQSKLQISFDGIDEVVTSSKEGAKEFREFLDRRSLN